MTDLPDIYSTDDCGVAMAEGDIRAIMASGAGHCQWYVKRGSLKFMAGGEHMVAQEGEMVWRLPHAPVEAVGGSDSLRVAVVEFSTEELRVAFGGTVPHELVDRAKEGPLFGASALKGRLSELREVMGQRGRLYYGTRVRAALALLQSELVSGTATAPPERGIIEQRHFSRFERLVARNVRDEHSVNWYAAQLCLSPPYLSQVVRAATGSGALAYINRRLAVEVAELLDVTDMTVQQIADATGFADQASLSKFFRRMKGMTPSEWRKK